MAPSRPFNIWTYRRPFAVGSIAGLVVVRSTMAGLYSTLEIDGHAAAADHTPAAGPEAIRNHRLAATLPDGRALEVEAGYLNMFNIGIAVRVDGVEVHRSHPGRPIQLSRRAQRMMLNAPGGGDGSTYDPGALARNRVPIIVDIALGLLFFVVAKLTDLPTAAIVGAGVGLALVVVQRFVKVDLLGGLALFGIVMLLASAALAVLFQDDMAVKLRSTVLGIAAAVAMLGDGALGGRWLGRGLARYLPYTDVDPRRVAIGMGLLGLVMAALNTAVAYLASTDVWLFYSTFVDFLLVVLLAQLMIRFARHQPLLPRRR